MDVRQLIESKAQEFDSILYGIERNDFQYRLNSELYNYNEDKDKLIFLYKLHPLRIMELERHKLVCTSPGTCRDELEYNEQIFFIEQEIKKLNPTFNFIILAPNIDTDLLKKNLANLAKYPSAGELLHSALDKLNEAKYERNVLDDLRLCLETLLKSKLNNDKSLENQKEHIGQYLKERGVSDEVRNMFVKLSDYYAKYQNEYVKHNDAVKQNEIELMVNLTSSMIYFITGL